MAHTVEIVANAVNLTLGLVIILQVLDLGRVLRQDHAEVLTARLFFAQDRFVRLTVVLLLGLVVFAVSNVFELYGDVVHIDWTVNELIEAVALVILIVSLLQFRRVLVPVLARDLVPAAQGGP